MDTNSMFSLMDIIVVACGIYIFYAYYLLMVKKEIKQGILISQKTDPKKCRDFENYKQYMSIRLLALGIMAIVSGGLGLYQDYVGKVDGVVYLIVYILFFGSLIWYVASVRKAEKLYW